MTRIANIACESRDDILLWNLDTVTVHPLAGIVETPKGLERTEFFQQYPYFLAGGTHVRERKRRPLDAQTVIDLLVQMLQEAA